MCGYRSKRSAWGELFKLILVCIGLIITCLILYFILVYAGYVTFYVLYHDSYNMTTGCKINRDRCSEYAKLMCMDDSGYGFYTGCIVIGFFWTPVLAIVIAACIYLISIIFEIIKSIGRCCTGCWTHLNMERIQSLRKDDYIQLV